MRQDKISGASEIEKKIILRVKKLLGKRRLFDECLSILSVYPSMASLWNIVNISFSLNKDEAEKEFVKMENAGKKVIEHAKELIKNATVITHSRSSTVLKLLKECKNIKVICTESRPRYEGRLLAKELCKKIDVTLVADSAIFSFIDKADLILMGADAILNNNVVNKIGTSAIALYAMEKGKPFYIISSSYKTFPFVMLKEESEKEIWREAPEGINIKNFYFDATPLRWISYFITEKGISAEAPKFSMNICKEVLEIRDKLEERGYLLIE